MRPYTIRLKYKPIVVLFLFICFCVVNLPSTAQDSLSSAQPAENVAAIFKQVMKGNIGLYNGSEYLYSAHNVKGFPFFKSADVLNGLVYYDGNLYTQVPMRFDLVTNEVVILDYTKNYPIKLVASKIDYFIIDSAMFLNGRNNNDFLLPQTAGFYQVLYNNKTYVFARKEKQLVFTSKLDENDNHYIEFDWYYIYSNNQLYKVENERTVLNVFKNRKTELKKFINANHLKFKKKFEDALVRTVAFYDQIEK